MTSVELALRTYLGRNDVRYPYASWMWALRHSFELPVMSEVTAEVIRPLHRQMSTIWGLSRDQFDDLYYLR